MLSVVAVLGVSDVFIIAIFFGSFSISKLFVSNELDEK